MCPDTVLYTVGVFFFFFLQRFTLSRALNTKDYLQIWPYKGEKLDRFEGGGTWIIDT